MPKLNFKLSESGYPVFYINIPDANICKAEIVIKCGSAHEDADSWGVAHFLEHFCFQGTPTKDKHQVNREQSLIGSYNAYTNYFNTAYHFDSLTQDFEKGLTLLKEVVFDSNYPEHEFEKEKSVIIEEWRMYDNDPSQHYFNLVTEKCFGSKEGHPIIGTEESIKEMTPEKLHRFRDKWYGKENMFIVVVGSLDFDRVMTAINSTFPAAKEVEKSPICLSEFLPKEQKYVFENNRFEQAQFGMICKWPSPEVTIKEKYLSKFFHWALHQYMHEYIRDDLGLCYGVGASPFSNFENSNLLISMLTSNDHLEKAEMELEALFEKIKTEGFPDEIFQICKKQQLYSRTKLLQDVHGVLNITSNGIMGSSNQDWFMTDGQRALDFEWIKECSDDLKPVDLQNFANQWLHGFTKLSMISTKN
jgi:predicted Zn-dependent peptidase